jgi:hypothetical protein
MASKHAKAFMLPEPIKDIPDVRLDENEPTPVAEPAQSHRKLMAKKYQIVGIHPVLKVSRIYALYAPEDEVEEYIRRGEKDGWTELQKYNQPQPSLWEEDETPTKPKKPRRKKGGG